MTTPQENGTFPRVYSGIFVLFAFLGLLAPPIVTAEQGNSYDPVEWNELVPADWTRPIILPAPSEDETHPPVERASLVEELDREKVSIAGFMIPTKFESNIVSEFLLVPFLEQHVQAHMHHDANQMVYVYLRKPRAIHNPYAPALVKGEIRVRSVDTDEGLAGYVIEQGTVEAYTY